MNKVIGNLGRQPIHLLTTYFYEGGLRVPLLVRCPGLTEPGSTCSAPVVSTDYYPTLLEMAAQPARPEQHLDGESIEPLLRGEARKRSPIFWHYPHYGNQGAVPGGAVREGDWKLIEWYDSGDVELYNLAEDLGEQRNLAASEADRTSKMQRMLHEWLKETGAVMPVKNPKYR